MAQPGTGGLEDRIPHWEHHYPLQGAFRRQLATLRFGADLKLDDLRDPMPPNEGSHTILVSQLPPSFPPPPPHDFSNPIWLFTYTLTLDGTPDDRLATSYHTAPENGNPQTRFMPVYTDELGANNLPLMTLSPATLRVIACPADFDDNGQADFFDYLDFADAFSRDEPAADFNRDARIDFFDYLDYLAAFEVGC